MLFAVLYRNSGFKVTPKDAIFPLFNTQARLFSTQKWHFCKLRVNPQNPTFHALRVLFPYSKCMKSQIFMICTFWQKCHFCVRNGLAWWKWHGLWIAIWHPIMVCNTKGPTDPSHFLLNSCIHVIVGHWHGVSYYFAGYYSHNHVQVIYYSKSEGYD